MNMELIATHNSATYRKGSGLLSWFATPFARCQNKTFREQYEAGCRYFDIRVKQDETGNGFPYYVCHGIWRTDCLSEVLSDLSNSVDEGESVFIDITWEGNVSNWNSVRASTFINDMKTAVTLVNRTSKKRTTLKLASVQGKAPFGTYLYKDPECPTLQKGFYGLYWFTWRLLLPIPWLWRKIYGQAEFNETTYTQVDFL